MRLRGKYKKSYFENSYLDEVAVVDKNTNRLIAIIDKREFVHEIFSVVPDNDEELVVYRDFTYVYKANKNGFNRYAHNVNSQHGEDGILKAVFDKIGTTSKYAIEFGGWDGVYLSNIRELIINRGFNGLFIEH